MIRRWQAYWQQRTRRERYLLLAMAAVMAVFLMWYGVWQPVRQGASEQQRHQQALMYLGQQLARLPLRENIGAFTEAALRASAAQHGLQPTAFTHRDKAIVIVLEDANGDALLAWLMALETQHQAVIQSFTLRGRSPANGRVDADVILSAHLP